MTYLYLAGVALDTTILAFWPSLSTKIHSMPILYLLSFRTWLIIGLIIIVIAVIDGGQRVLESRIKKPGRPQIEGGIWDIRFNELWESLDRFSASEILDKRQQKEAPSPSPVAIGILPSGDKVIGSHVTLRVHFVNEAETETPIRNFQLEISTDNGNFVSPYPEGGEIIQSGFGQRPEDAKRFGNLIDLIQTGEKATLNEHFEGHLHFIVRGLILSETAWAKATVLVLDGWREPHPLRDKLSAYSLLPSDRLVLRKEQFP